MFGFSCIKNIDLNIGFSVAYISKNFFFFLIKNKNYPWSTTICISIEQVASQSQRKTKIRGIGISQNHFMATICTHDELEKQKIE